MHSDDLPWVKRRLTIQQLVTERQRVSNDLDERRRPAAQKLIKEQITDDKGDEVDEVVEERWQTDFVRARYWIESYEICMGVGVRMLLCWWAAMTAWRFCGVYWNYKRNRELNSSDDSAARSGALNMSFDLVCGVINTVSLAAIGLSRPPPGAPPVVWRRYLYFALVMAWCVYPTAVGFPPLAPRCRDLEKLREELRDREPDAALGVWQRIANSDCAYDNENALQGHSYILLLMFWMLLTPRLVPSLRLMYVTIAWAGGCYLTCLLMNSGFYPNVVGASFVFLSIVVATGKKFYIEKGQWTKFLFDLKQREASEKMFHILEFMVPVHVIVPMLKNPGAVIAEQVDKASTLFVMITGFDQYARKLSPEQLLNFLNRYFTEFERLSAMHRVTKIETVMEEYVCAVGVVPADRELDAVLGHGQTLGRLVAFVLDVLTLQTLHSDMRCLKSMDLATSKVEFKMGMHTGPIVAGVIGAKLPRFRLFGDTINTAARMMQKGLPGELQFGEETRRELPAWVPVQAHGEIEMKGKGRVMTYILDRGAFSLHGRPSGATRASRPQHDAGTTVAPGPQASQEGSHIELQERASRHRAQGRVKWCDLEQDSAHPHTPRVSLHSVVDTPSSARGPPLCAARTSLCEPLTSRKHNSVDQTTTSFEEVIEEVSATGSHKTACCGREDFPVEMELGFREWYHENNFCKKLYSRLDRQALALCLLTAGETLFSLMQKTFSIEGCTSGAHWYGPKLRPPVFLTCRALSVSIILAWRTVVARYDWVSASGRNAQFWMLGSVCGIVLLTFISYDALSCSQDSASRNSLVFVIIFDQAFGSHAQHHFLSSVVFVGLAMLAVIMQSSIFTNPYFSQSGKILFVCYCILNLFVARTSEGLLRSRYRAKQRVDFTHERIGHILNTLMPPLVVKDMAEMGASAAPPSHAYGRATIAQSDIVGFTKLASTLPPQEVVEFVSQLFGLFDALTDRYEVYKVETVGDAYIAGQAEEPLTLKNSPLAVVLFALEMVKATQDWARRKRESVSCRVGVHSGECIGGMVGAEMQRYHLFGELMTSVEVLESTAPSGKVQVSRACKEAVELQLHEEGLPWSCITMEPREEPHLSTSKGDVHEYSDVGGMTYIVRSYSQFIGFVGK